MTTYYVRKTGSNSNNGTSPSTAWLTVTHALSANGASVTGSAIYVGAGVYRETVAPAISGYSLATNASVGYSSLSSASGSVALSSVGSLVAPPVGYSSPGYMTLTLPQSASVQSVGFTWTGINGSILTGVTFLTNTSVTSSASVAVGASVTVGSPIFVIGDVDGAQTGDAGQVTLTAYTTNDTTAPSSTVLLGLATHSYLTFSLLTFIGGTTSSITNTTGVGYTFADCTVNGTQAGNNPTVSLIAVFGIPINALIDRCVMVNCSSGNSAFLVTLPTAATGSDYDALCLVRNSLLIGTSRAVEIAITGSSAVHGGGVRTYNSTLFGGIDGVITAYAQLSTLIPCEVHNSIVMGGVCLTAITSGQIVESFNMLLGTTTRTNVSAGTGSQTTAYAPLLELGQSYKWGAGTLRQFLAPDGSGSPILGFGSDGSGSDPTVDWQNRPRPSGGGASITPVGVASVSAVGYMERHDISVQSTASVQAGTSSGQIIGPGDQFIQVPVDAISSTLSIYLLFSAGYGGTNYPAVVLLTQNEIGVTTQTQTCSPTSGLWQQLTFSAITPSKQGWVTLQINSYDTSGTGSVWFDTLAVM